MIGCRFPRNTNIRYSDDMTFYEKSLHEDEIMIEKLLHKLKNICIYLIVTTIIILIYIYNISEFYVDLDFM